MSRLSNENILVIGDRERRMHPAVASAMPSASVTSVQSIFDAIAELNAGVYSGVLVNIEPLANRPEAAAQCLRDAAGNARLVLYAEPAFEPLSRSLLDHGADDYVIAPAEPGELQSMLAGAPLRAVISEPASVAAPAETEQVPDPLAPLLEMPLTDLVLSVMIEHPQQAVATAVRSIGERIAPTMSLTMTGVNDPMPMVASDRITISHPVRADDTRYVGRLLLEAPVGVDEATAQHALAQIASLLGKVQQIDDRQARLQKLAITDELTGVYNSRYFKHFLGRMIDRAKTRRFPVTLLLFDIDNFKQYNDTFGHGVGDEILKQTASLMKRCSRDHDLVARISGDEFAVVFWEKEGPRTPYDPTQQPSGRLPSTPLIIADRFRKLLGKKDFSEFNALGPTGKGVLTISGGMAVFPYDGRTVDELVEAADKALMFGAKKGGKNSIFLVGGDSDAASGGD